MLVSTWALSAAVRASVPGQGVRGSLSALLASGQELPWGDAGAEASEHSAGTPGSSSKASVSGTEAPPVLPPSVLFAATVAAV